MLNNMRLLREHEALRLIANLGKISPALKVLLIALIAMRLLCSRNQQMHKLLNATLVLTGVIPVAL